MARPVQSALSEQRLHCGEAGLGKYLNVGHLVPSVDAKDAAKTLRVETVHLLLLLGIGCPAFTPIQEGADYAYVVHCHFG